MLLSLPVVGITDSVYFTVVNDRLQDLSDETMPYGAGGRMYVPLSLFNQTSLRTYSVFDRSSNMASIFSTLHYLRFDFTSGATFDDAGKLYSFRAIFHNSTVYVPVEDICDFFGFDYSIYYMAPAPFVRIKNSNARFSDTDFAKSKYLSMQSDYNVYTNVPAPTDDPVAPTPPAPSDEAPEKSVAVYMSFFGINDGTGDALSSLDYYGLNACFFVTADEIRENPDLIRRISGSGHTVGFVCSENLAEDYFACASALRAVCRTTSILVSLDGRYTQALKDKADELGVILWCDESLPRYTLNSSMSSRTVSRAIDDAGERLDLSFSCTEDTDEVIDNVLYYVYRGDCTAELIRETAVTFLNTSGVS